MENTQIIRARRRPVEIPEMLGVADVARAIYDMLAIYPVSFRFEAIGALHVFAHRELDAIRESSLPLKVVSRPQGEPIQFPLATTTPT